MDRWFRRWDYRRKDDIPPGHPGDRAQEIREFYIAARGEWTLLAVEDPAEVLNIAYSAVHRAFEEVPLIVSRAYKHGDWNLKAYHKRDLLFKVGDDPDNELAWVGRPLTVEGIPEVLRLLGGNAAFETFLDDVANARRPDPRDLVDGLGLPSLARGFPELAESAAPEWAFAAWVHRSSPLFR